MSDISHMGEVRVSGPLALDFLNQTLTNDLRRITVGQGQYTLMCHERGGVIDDLYAYRVADDQFLLIINASRIDVDVDWLQCRLAQFPHREKVALENVSEGYGAVAVQGPAAIEFMSEGFFRDPSHPAAAVRVRDLQKNQVGSFLFGHTPVWVACTGYTGEHGFEVVAPAELMAGVWNKIMAAGAPHGLKPAGLGARDTLRTEAGYPLYGHELDEKTTPIEAGLAAFVRFEKMDFVGRAVLAEQTARGTLKKCVAFKMTDRSAPPRPNYPIWSSGADAKPIGQVVSGTQSPWLGIGIGLGYVPPEFAKAGTPIEVEIRGRRAPAVVVPKPIYRRPNPVEAASNLGRRAEK